jgi:hypothetical protein
VQPHCRVLCDYIINGAPDYNLVGSNLFYMARRREKCITYITLSLNSRIAQYIVLVVLTIDWTYLLYYRVLSVHDEKTLWAWPYNHVHSFMGGKEASCGSEYVDIAKPIPCFLLISTITTQNNTNQTGTCIIHTKTHMYLNFLYTMTDGRYSIGSLQYIGIGMKP